MSTPVNDVATPRTANADQPYLDALSEGNLILPVCRHCGCWHWPAPFRCAKCGSWDIGWAPASLEGSIFSWTRTHHPFSGCEAFDTPFVSVVVSLDQPPGIRLLGTLSGPEEELGIGKKVMGYPSQIEAFGKTVPCLKWSLA
tara:strand:+ start:18703 stop:19128 length:426 start_codon:yes stop_codon:yes gene_type:complete